MPLEQIQYSQCFVPCFESDMSEIMFHQYSRPDPPQGVYYAIHLTDVADNGRHDHPF